MSTKGNGVGTFTPYSQNLPVTGDDETKIAEKKAKREQKKAVDRSNDVAEYSTYLRLPAKVQSI